MFAKSRDPMIFVFLVLAALWAAAVASAPRDPAAPHALTAEIVPALDGDVERSRPAVAFDPATREHLLLFERRIGGQLDLAAQRLAADGTPIGRAFAVAETSHDERRPRLAHAPGQREYLLVYELDLDDDGGDHVMARRLSTDGTPLGAAFPISPPAGQARAPEVAYLATVSSYLVVYESDLEGGIAGRRVASDGAPLDEVVRIAEGVKEPHLAANPATGEFLVVGVMPTGTEDGVDIFGMRLDADGRTLTNPFRVGGVRRGGVPADDHNPHVVYNATHGAYLVVWEADLFGDGTHVAIASQQLDAAGHPTGRRAGFAMVAERDGPARHPRQTSNLATGEHWIVWEEERDGIERVVARPYRIHSEGRILGRRVRVSAAAAPSLWPDLVVDPATGALLVAWEAEIEGRREVRGRLLRATAPASAPSPASAVELEAGAMNTRSEKVVPTRSAQRKTTGFETRWHSVDSGGTTSSTGGSFALGGTTGQVDAGLVSGGAYALTGGFWGARAPPPVGGVEVTVTPEPTSLDEPGGVVRVTVRIDNLGNVTADITSLADAGLGDLGGRGDCTLPLRIVPGSAATCAYDAPIAGVAGDSVPVRVTASGSGPAGPLVGLGEAAVTLTGMDFGDAPDPTYPTLLARDGARHVLGSGLVLGTAADAEPDGQPQPAALGDDGDGSDDEDGAVFSPLVVGEMATVDVETSGPCRLDAWVDFGADGAWSADERIFASLPLVAGANAGLAFNVPASAAEGPTFARLRCSTAGGLEPIGEAADGEVEDHQVTIAAVDLGIALSAAPNPVVAGTDLTYQLTVTNAGVAPSAGATATLALPSGVTFLASPSCVPAGAMVSCEVGALAIGAEDSALVIARVGPEAAGALLATASVSAAEIDRVPANDTATLVTAVTREADLALTLDAAPEPATASRTFTYTVTVANTGPSQARDVGVTVGLAPEVQLVGTSGCLEDPGGVPSCNLGDLALGATVQATFTVVVDAAASSTLTTTASVTSEALDRDPSDNAVTRQTQIAAAPDYTIPWHTVDGGG